MIVTHIEGKPLNEITKCLVVANENLHTSPTDTLYAQAKRIAEGFANVFKPDLFTDIGQRISSLFEQTPRDAQLVGIDSDISMWLTRVNYIKLSVVQVYRPVGLIVSYGEYLTVLDEAFQKTKAIDDVLLKPIESFLMNILNNPSMLGASAVPRDKNPFYTLKVDELGKAIGECFDPHQKNDRYSFCEAYLKTDEYESTASRMNRLKSEVDSVSLKAIRTRTESIFSMVDQLSKNIQEIEHYRQMTKQVSDRLARDIQMAAIWVEFYAVLVRQVYVLNVAMKDSAAHLKKMTAKQFK